MCIRHRIATLILEVSTETSQLRKKDLPVHCLDTIDKTFTTQLSVIGEENYYSTSIYRRGGAIVTTDSTSPQPAKALNPNNLALSVDKPNNSEEFGHHCFLWPYWTAPC
jgi:hypothetical protein